MSSSARVPFIPSSRPASRAAHFKDQPQNPAKSKVNQQFLADPVNPLHSSSNTKLGSAKSQSKSQNNANSTSQLPTAALDKPLNIGGLLKNTSFQTAPGPPQTPGIPRRPSFPGSNVIMRPGTADPHSNGHRHQNQRDQVFKIVAPVPRQASRSASPTLSNNLASNVFSFSPPTPKSSLPTQSPPQPTPESTQRPKDAHTPASGLGFCFSKPHTVAEQHQHVSQQLPSPPSTIRASSISVFEPSSVIQPDNQTPLLPFTLNMQLPNQTGPQRVLLNPDGTRSTLDNTLDHSLNLDDTRHGHRNRAAQDQQQLKRPRAELENDDQSDDHDGHLKKYKNRTEGYNPRPQSMTSPPQSSGPEHTRAMPPGYRHHDGQLYSQGPSTPPQRRDRDQDQDQHHHHENYQDQDVSMLDGDSEGHRTLDKLLGCDTDAYIEEHMEKYERAVNRWRDCTMDEWITGADELAAKYVKILDFVKDHMAAKMKLFASFNEKVEKHNAVLDQREKTLDDMKARLVQESGNVLGRG